MLMYAADNILWTLYRVPTFRYLVLKGMELLRHSSVHWGSLCQLRSRIEVRLPSLEPYCRDFPSDLHISSRSFTNLQFLTSKVESDPSVHVKFSYKFQYTVHGWEQKYVGTGSGIQVDSSRVDSSLPTQFGRISIVLDKAESGIFCWVWYSPERLLWLGLSFGM
jgi:hypothetical protein